MIPKTIEEFSINNQKITSDYDQETAFSCQLG